MFNNPFFIIFFLDSVIATMRKAFKLYFVYRLFASLSLYAQMAFLILFIRIIKNVLHVFQSLNDVK